jgi:hypothetical protein
MIKIKPIVNKKNNQMTISVPRRKLKLGKNEIPTFFMKKSKKGVLIWQQ